MPRKRLPVGPGGTSLAKPELFRAQARNLDLASCIMEEVALEGLDGITFQALLVRLAARPKFHFKITEKTKGYVWEVAKRQRHLTAYLLEESRADLVLFDRRNSVDERGNMYEPISAPEDIYPYHPIYDQKAGIRGSCKEYYTRRPYTSVARRMKYETVQEKCGNRLVFVAPQQLREKMFMSDDAGVDLGELTIIQYCIVERVARARYLGEGTRGKVSLASMKIDPKSSFYQRKLLLKKNLITKQTLTMKFGPTHVTAGVSILHLPKFFTYYETVLKSTVSKAIKSIVSTPNNMIEMSQLRAALGKHQVQNLLSPECLQIFEEVSLPYHEAHTSAEYQMDASPEKKVKISQRVVKYMKLRDPRITPANFSNLLSKGGDEKEEIEDTSDAYLPVRFHTTQSSILHRFMHFIFESKARGLSIAELSEKADVTQLDARSAVRFFQRHKIAIPILEDKKKTKQHRYVYYKFKEANRNYQTIEASEVQDPSYPGPSNASQIPLLDLEPDQEALEGEIIWTVGDLEIASAGRALGTAEENVEVVRKASSTTTKNGRIRKSVLARSKLPKKKRSTLSYKDADDGATVSLRLTAQVRQLMETFPANCDPDTEEFSDTAAEFENRFNQSEEKDFIPIREADKSRTLMCVNPAGWQILAEWAILRPVFGRLPSFATTRTTERANYILELIYTCRVIIGFQHILRAVRQHEISQLKSTSERSDVDRRTLYRILGQLHSMQFIQIYKVRVQKDNIIKACALFTPYSVSMESKLVLSSIDFIIASTEARARKTLEEKKAHNARDRLIRRHTARKWIPSGCIEKTTVRAKPGTKPGSKILRKVVRGVRYANKAKVIPKPRKRFDQIDMDALARIKRARVDWSSMEDRFVMASFLASVLFLPRYNHQRIIMFNAHQIRDLFHARVDLERIKTSLAIRRRLHFLMKKHEFYSRYRYYLSEALQDPVLYNRHLKAFQEKTAGKVFARIPTRSLVAVIEYLQGKFRKLSIDPTVIARDELEDSDGDNTMDFNPAAQISADEEEDISPERRINIAMQHSGKCIIVDALDTPFDFNSIEVWTARTAVLSLVMRGDEVENVHRFLETISDEVLSFTINSMRDVGLTTWQKETSRFGPSMVLKRKLQAGLDPEKYLECSTFLEEFNQDMRKSFTFNGDDQATVGIFCILCELNSLNLVDFSITLPDPIATINPEWYETFRAISEGVGNCGIEDNDDDDDGRYALKNKDIRYRKRLAAALSSGPSRKESLPSASKKRKVERDGNGPPSGIDSDDEVDPYHPTQFQNILGLEPNTALKLSNKAMSIVRSQINAHKSGDFVERHFFNVNLPGVETVGERDGFEQIINRGAQPKLTLKEIKTHLIKVIPYHRLGLTETYEPIAKPVNLGRWEQLYNYIASTREIGISLPFLQTKFTRRTLNDGLRSLIIKNAIFLVGVTYRKFVAVEYVESWTMPVVHDKGCPVVQKVVFRPWITSNGGIQWSIIDQTMSCVLGYVGLYPESTVEALCAHFRPTLSPVETMMIIDALVGFEFFNLYALERKGGSTSAFSASSLVSKNYSVDTFLDMESLHIELNSLTTSRYTKLQQLFVAEEKLEQRQQEANNA